MSFEGWSAASYGDTRAHAYDRQAASRGDVEAAVALLRELAGDGPALELGVGTGRLAIPLAATGVAVTGLDTSQAMLDRLRDADGGGRVTAVLADAADFDLGRTYPLVWVAFNSFFLIDDAERQRSCLRAVARHLAPGGVFVVEAFVPRPEQITGSAGLRVKHFDADHILLQASRHDADAQIVESLDIDLASSGFELFPTRVRYCHPAELDDMAAAAGLARRDRWASWARAPFGDDSAAHVSVYAGRAP